MSKNSSSFCWRWEVLFWFCRIWLFYAPYEWARNWGWVSDLYSNRCVVRTMWWCGFEMNVHFAMIFCRRGKDQYASKCLWQHLQISYKSLPVRKEFNGDVSILGPVEESNSWSGTKLKSPQMSRCPCFDYCIFFIVALRNGIWRWLGGRKELQ